MLRPAVWWKKNAPRINSSAATIELAISKTTPTLLTALTSRMLMMLIAAATTIVIVASRTMSPCVGDVQMSLAKTEARATAVAAVPAMNANRAV